MFQTKKKNSLLWKFKSKESELEHFLFASIHLIDNQIENIIQQVLPFVQACDVFAGEINFSEEAIHDVKECLFLSDDFLYSESYQKFITDLQFELFRRYKIDIYSFSHLKPIVFSNFISLLLLHCSPDQNVDRKLFDFAQMHSKELIGLEDFHEHFSILNSISETEQFAMVSKSFSNLKQLRMSMNISLKKYKNQEINYLYKFGKKMLGKHKSIMLYQRNTRMVETLLNYCDTKSVFATCGAAHFDGKYGILAQLKRKGFECKPVHI